MTTTPAQPNILLIMADQLSALATAPYGNREVLTPHLAALAERGAVFERAYCNAPLCVPARAALMTGQLPSRLDVFDNGTGFGADVPTFVHHLRRGGYRTALSGKMHFVGPDQLHGFEERLTTDIYPADARWTPNWDRLAGQVRRAEDEGPGGPETYPRHMTTAITATQAGVVTWDKSFAYDEEVHHRASEWLRDREQHPDGRPWFLCVSYTHPHDPYVTTRDYWERYDGVAIAPPTPEAADPPAADRWVKTYHGLDRVAPTDEERRRARRGYYANTSFIDDKVGDLLATLARLALAEDTIVIFTSDHGDQCGEHGLWFKRTVREWSARVPLILAGPGIPTARRVAANVSHVDLFPTLVALAGLRLPRGYATFAPPLDGRDLTPLLRADPPADWPGEVIIEQCGEGTFRPIRALVRDRFKLVATHGAPDQLYDLTDDPRECRDLAGHPDYCQVGATLRARLSRDWDPLAIERRVRASQRRRIFLNEARYQGAYTPWDYQPTFDATRAYVRRDPSRPWAAQVYASWLVDGHERTQLLDDAETDPPRDATVPGA